MHARIGTAHALKRKGHHTRRRLTQEAMAAAVRVRSLFPLGLPAEFSGRWPGAKAGHPNAPGAAFDGQGLAELLHKALTGSVEGEFRQGHAAGQRTHLEDPMASSLDH